MEWYSQIAVEIHPTVGSCSILFPPIQENSSSHKLFFGLFYVVCFLVQWFQSRWCNVFYMGIYTNHQLVDGAIYSETTV